MVDAKYATPYRAALVGFWSSGRLNTTRYEVAMMSTQRNKMTACAASGVPSAGADVRTTLTA